VSLSVEESVLVDEHGNAFAYCSHAYVRRRGILRKVLTTDVFFIVSDPAP
jgi:hypothetical protein